MGIRRAEKPEAATSSAARLGFEGKLWAAANALCGSRDAAKYKHVVLGLIFLKYISDAFEEHHARAQAQRDRGVDAEGETQRQPRNTARFHGQGWGRGNFPHA